MKPKPITLREHRENVLMKTMQEVADSADLALSTIHIAERGWRMPMRKRWRKMACAYRVTEAHLVRMFEAVK